MQERTESSIFQAQIEHQPVQRFVINTHAFHNAHLLRTTLPRHLFAPILIFQDRKEKHFEMATSLQATQETKRTASKARAAQKKNLTATGKRPRLDIVNEEEGL